MKVCGSVVISSICTQSTLTHIPIHSYQYDLWGFPIAQAQDKANRMKFHKSKLYKKCSACDKQTLNKTYHHFCCDCLLEFYLSNSLLSDISEEK